MLCSLLMLGLSLISQEPRYDESFCSDLNGRTQTLNGHGFCDPNPNEVTQAYAAWGLLHARRAGSEAEQGWVLEVGGGLGFLARKLVGHGVHYLFNDMSKVHCDLAERHIRPMAQYPTQYRVFPGAFPNELQKEERVELRARRIVGIGAFMVLHFMTGDQIKTLFDEFWAILPRGGRIFLTAATPYNGHLRGFQDEYARRRELPRSDPKARFPGEITDAHVYLDKEKYPKFLHVLEPDVLFRAVKDSPDGIRRFTLVNVFDIRRPNPPEQRWLGGYRDGKTELMGLILEKL